MRHVWRFPGFVGSCRGTASIALECLLKYCLVHSRSYFPISALEPLPQSLSHPNFEIWKSVDDGLCVSEDVKPDYTNAHVLVVVRPEVEFSVL